MGGPRLSRLRWLAPVGVAVVLVAGAAIVGRIGPRPQASPVIAQPSVAPAAPTPAEPASAPLPTVTAADLGIDVVLRPSADPGAVTVLRSDGTGTSLRLTPAPRGEVTVVPDGAGGVVWQQAGGGAIRRLTSAGEASTVIASAGSLSAPWRLVGFGEAEALLVTSGDPTDAMGSRAGLVGVTLFDAPARTLSRDDRASDITMAAAIEDVLYVRSGPAADEVVLAGPVRAPQTVLTAAAGDVLGVAYGEGEAAYVLLGTRVVAIDGASGTVREHIEIPVGDGEAAGPLSTRAGHVLVNRRSAEGWLAPLVLDTASGSWAVLDAVGLAQLALPTAAPLPVPPCVADAERRDAPPTPGGALDLYLSCPSEDVLYSAYRLDAEIDPTGDVAADARAVLELLFDGGSEATRERGYEGLDRRTSSGGTIAIRALHLDGATLVLDFAFPPDGVGLLNASTARARWHTLLAANLLQFEQVETIELRADGTCSYGDFFEMEGCVRLDRDDAPWHR